LKIEKKPSMVLVDAAAHVLASLVVHAAMTKEMVAKLLVVNPRFVGENVGFAVDILHDDRKDVLAVGVFTRERTALAALATYQRQDRHHMTPSTHRELRAGAPPVVSLVDLYHAAFAAKRRKVGGRIASRMRCDINQAVLRVTPRVR
jgi:hypothetical protein